MCHSRDYMSFEDQQKLTQEQANEDRRTETIDIHFTF
jgi:nitrate/TMAO reductase-like tetraheme cytochrome c subunit